jgi:23S rRNA (guanosine2251-2'-O)-methyltransferase
MSTTQGQPAAGETVLEGHISVSAALQAGYRSIRAVYLQRGRHHPQVERAADLARSLAVPVKRVDADVVAAHAAGRSHGGIIALAGARNWQTFEELIVDEATPFLTMLDGLEDPYNLGQAIRALYAAGATGLVLRQRDWRGADGVVARASAGASELMPTAVVASAEEALAGLRSATLRVACAVRGRNVPPVDQVDLTGGLFLIVGGEKRGISRPVVESADLLFTVPYGRVFQPSLGATAATAVIAYEVMRQRRRGGLNQR